MNKHAPYGRKKKDKLQKHSMNVLSTKLRRRRPDLVKNFKSRDKLGPKKSYKSSKRKVSLKLDEKRLQILKQRERSSTMKAFFLSSKACNAVKLKTLR